MSSLDFVSPAAVGLNANRWAAACGQLKAWFEDGTLPSATLIAGRGDAIVEPVIFGSQDLEGNSPIRKDACFLVASITKPQRHRRKPQHSRSRNRQADPRAADGPETARAAGRHADRVGRRVRAATGFAGRQGGRDHNPKGFTYWLAGGGVKGGHSHGETDELGHEAVVDRHHIRDLHATILHLMGLDHRRLTYFYGGLDHSLTGVLNPRVIEDVVA